MENITLKRVICILALSFTTVACVSKNAPPAAAKTANKDVPQTCLNQHEQEILASVESNAVLQQLYLTGIKNQLTQLTDEVKNLKLTAPETAMTTEPTADPKACSPAALGDKFILGAIEHVYVNEVKASFNTRIDTGAESSSLDARNIVLFERDGQSWVRFDVHTKGMQAPANTFEAKVKRFVRIKQDASEKDPDRRPVILAHLRIGDYEAQTELNLVDRSHLDYPLLLGRKFMQDIAVVDVSQSFIHGTSDNNNHSGQ